MDKVFAIVGCIAALMGVLAGAFAAHGLKNLMVPESLEVFQTGVRYQIYHALALLFVAWAISRWEDSIFNIAGVSFILGIMLFTGSLYLISLTGIKWLGFITPVGGVAFIFGWLILAYGIYRS